MRVDTQRSGECDCASRADRVRAEIEFDQSRWITAQRLANGRYARRAKFIILQLQRGQRGIYLLFFLDGINLDK